MLISYFPAYFPLHYQTSENTLLKFTFPEFTFQKKTTFQQTNGAYMNYRKVRDLFANTSNYKGVLQR